MVIFLSPVPSFLFTFLSPSLFLFLFNSLVLDFGTDPRPSVFMAFTASFVSFSLAHTHTQFNCTMVSLHLKVQECVDEERKEKKKMKEKEEEQEGEKKK